MLQYVVAPVRGDEMEKFNRTLRGYDPDEVNSFLDRVIGQVEKMIAEINSKDEEIARLKKLDEENKKLRQKLEQYNRIEGTLNNAILMAQKTSDQMKMTAHKESELILNDAKKNASRIVNEALMKAEKTENEAMMLKRNIIVFKKRLRAIVEQQLDVVNDIDRIDF